MSPPNNHDRLITAVISVTSSLVVALLSFICFTTYNLSVHMATMLNTIGYHGMIIEDHEERIREVENDK